MRSSFIATCLALLATTVVGRLASAADSAARAADYVARSAERDWVAEVSAAQSSVDAARAAVATEPLPLVHALTQLGEAQLGQGDLEAAATTFRESLTLVEQRIGVASSELFGPLNGLGRSLARAGDHAAAALVLERGLQIARRSFGLFAIEQDEVLRHLATSLRASGRGADADQAMIYTLYVAERTFGEGDPRVVAAMCALGEWFTAESRFDSAGASLQTALNIVEKKIGPDDLTMVVPLTALARTYMAQASQPPLDAQGQRLPLLLRPKLKDAAGADVKTGIDPRRLNETGEAALVDALRILDATPTAPRELVIDTLLQAGDWFQIRRQTARSLEYYRRASSLLAAATLARGNDPLGFPLLVYYRAPVLATRNRLPAELVDEQYVEVELTVQPDGSVDAARLKSATTEQRLIKETLAAVRSSRYRPRFENGEPIATTAITYREEFRVRKEVPK